MRRALKLNAMFMLLWCKNSSQVKKVWSRPKLIIAKIDKGSINLTEVKIVRNFLFSLNIIK